MEITAQQNKDVELIAVQGRLDSIEAPRLAEALEQARRAGRYTIVVDMSQLEYMSSAGFRALAEAQKDCRRHQGEVVLARVPETVREALDLVGFADYFHLAGSVDSALEYTASLLAGSSGPRP